MKKYLPMLLLTCVALWSCASAFEQARLDHFNQYGDRYRLALLRGEYGQAAGLLDPDQRKTTDFEKLKEIKIVDYNPTSRVISPNKTEIRQDVGLQYYAKSYNILKTVHYQQVWVYKEEGRIWQLQTDLPDFKP